MANLSKQDGDIYTPWMMPGIVGIGLIVAQVPDLPAGDYPVGLAKENLSSNSDDERQGQCGGVVQAHQGRGSSGDAQPVVEAVTVP
jgi:hypothetical protein